MPLWERCGGRCEASGQPITFDSFDMHHRRNLGMGGTSRTDAHDLDNLLALSPVIHNGSPQAVHSRRPWAQERGYLVPKHDNHPGMRPVWLHGRRWVLLGKDGQYHDPPIPLPPPRG